MTPRRVAILLAGLLLASCATLPPTFEPESSSEGTVSWWQGADLLTARIAFQTAPAGGRRLLVGEKGALLTLTRRGGEWTARGSLVRGEERGPETTAPAALTGWMSLAEAYDGAASTPAGNSDVRTGRFSARYEKSGVELRGFELVTVATGARFRVTFPREPGH